jgi:hypothetical protein
VPFGQVKVPLQKQNAPMHDSRCVPQAEAGDRRRIRALPARPESAGKVGAASMYLQAARRKRDDAQRRGRHTSRAAATSSAFPNQAKAPPMDHWYEPSQYYEIQIYTGKRRNTVSI